MFCLNGNSNCPLLLPVFATKFGCHAAQARLRLRKLKTRLGLPFDFCLFLPLTAAVSDWLL